MSNENNKFMNLNINKPSYEEYEAIYNDCLKFINKVLDKIDQSIPDRLYHYTSIDGLHSIIKEKCLRATDINFLNDISERKHANTIFKKKLEKCNIEDEYKKKIVNVIESHERSSPISIDTFIFSFTEEKDLLSQWRGYCHNGGVSIGFSGKTLKKVFDESLFEDIEELNKGFMPFAYFTNCLYDKSDDDKIDSIIENIFCYIKEKKDYKFINPIIDSLVHVFNCKVAPYIKHHAFKEEKELRIVATVLREHAKKKIYYRNKNNKIIPYIRLDITQLLEDIKIIVSPGLDYKHTKEGIEKFLDTNGIAIKNDTISQSEIPFREVN